MSLAAYLVGWGGLLNLFALPEGALVNPPLQVC